MHYTQQWVLCKVRLEVVSIIISNIAALVRAWPSLPNIGSKHLSLPKSRAFVRAEGILMPHLHKALTLCITLSKQQPSYLHFSFWQLAKVYLDNTQNLTQYLFVRTVWKEFRNQYFLRQTKTVNITKTLRLSSLVCLTKKAMTIRLTTWRKTKLN